MNNFIVQLKSILKRFEEGKFKTKFTIKELEIFVRRKPKKLTPQRQEITERQFEATNKQLDKLSSSAKKNLSKIIDPILRVGPFRVLSSWVRSGIYKEQSGLFVDVTFRNKTAQSVTFKGIPKNDLVLIQQQEIRTGTYLWRNPRTRPQMIKFRKQGKF